MLFPPGQSLEHLLLSGLPYGPRHNSSNLTTMQFTFSSVFCKPSDFQPNSAAPSSAQSLLQHPRYLRKLLFSSSGTWVLVSRVRSNSLWAIRSNPR